MLRPRLCANCGRVVMPLALKYAFRRLAKSPQFTLLSVLMLGLGIALSTAAFGIANGALLRPLPLADPEQLVAVFTVSRQGARLPLPPGNAIELRDALGDIGDFELYQPRSENVAEPGQPAEEQRGMSIQAGGLRMLGVQPVLGRDFLPDESKPGSQAVVLLTHRWWVNHFGSDPGVIGRVLRIDTADHVVIGVLPPYFDEPLLWYGSKYVRGMIVWDDWIQERANKWMNVIGRLKPGVSLPQARVRLDSFAAKLAQDYPEKFGTDRLLMVPLGSSFAGEQMRTIYWLVVALAAFVLLIACANLGSVQLARAFGRRGELAVRAALGATRGDLMGALAVESVLLGLGGTALGVLLTYWSRSLIARWLTGPVMPIDARVLAFAAGAGLLAVVCFGILPAWLITRGTMAKAMQVGGRGSTGGGAHAGMKGALIIAQLGLALVLVSAASSLVLGVRSFLQRDRGWQPDGLISGAMHVPYGWVPKEQEEPRLAQLIEQKLGAIPGVREAGFAASVPLYGAYPEMPLLPEGVELPAPGHEPLASVVGANPAFFRALGINPREGRLFAADWRPADPPVAVVSVNTARALWPNENALGKRVRFARDGPWHEIIGIVPDVNFEVGFSSPMAALQAYFPVQEMPTVWYNFVLQTPAPAASLERSIRAAVAGVDPDILVRDIGDVPQMLERYASNRPLMVILVTFATAGLVIAMVGLYGVMSQLTQQRRRDIGVRIALGATYDHIMLLMLGHGGRLLGLGVAIGTAGAFAANILLHRAMPTLPTVGWVGEGIIGLMLGLAGLAACYPPSHRAARVDPVEVLRSE